MLRKTWVMTPLYALSQTQIETTNIKIVVSKQLLFSSLHFISQRIELVASSSNEWVAEILQEYHYHNITNKKLISKLLLAEHGIHMRYVYLFWPLMHFAMMWSSEATVAHRHKNLGLHGSQTSSCMLPVTVKHQLVLDQMAKDPGRHQGPDLIKEGIAFGQGIHISHDFVTAEMRWHGPAGFRSLVSHILHLVHITSGLEMVMISSQALASPSGEFMISGLENGLGYGLFQTTN